MMMNGKKKKKTIVTLTSQTQVNVSKQHCYAFNHFIELVLISLSSCSLLHRSIPRRSCCLTAVTRPAVLVDVGAATVRLQ